MATLDKGPSKSPAMPAHEMSDPGPDHSISFKSKGPVLNPIGQSITSDHSILTDVAGHEVWLHHEKHHHNNGRVHMPLSHAKDMGLVPTDTPMSEPVSDALSPGAQPQPPTDAQQQHASSITQQGTDKSPTKPGAPSKLENELPSKPTR